MSNLAEPIRNLKVKIEELVTAHEQLKNKYQDLTVKNEELTQKIVVLESAENKNEELNKSITESRVQIDELVQEIDDCIYLLK